MALNSTTSTALRNHRRKICLEGIAQRLDQLCEQCDSFAPAHPDWLRLIDEIATDTSSTKPKTRASNAA